jgi:hypothetical protein
MTALHAPLSVLDSAGTPPATLSEGYDAASVTIPDAHFLFHADFKRAGSDLILTGEDGHRVVVSGYFKHEHLPALLSPDGGALTGDVVEALVGSQAPDQYAQYAQAGTPVQTSPLAIGRVALVEGGATAFRNGVPVSLNVGDVVIKGDVIQTAGNSAVGVTFSDGTTFSLSSNARMVLNDFVYSPGGSASSALVSLVQGSITFVAGEVAHTGDMRVSTPVATMGIRGTAVNVTPTTVRPMSPSWPRGISSPTALWSTRGPRRRIWRPAGLSARCLAPSPVTTASTASFPPRRESSFKRPAKTLRRCRWNCSSSRMSS